MEKVEQNKHKQMCEEDHSLDVFERAQIRRFMSKLQREVLINQVHAETQPNILWEP